MKVTKNTDGKKFRYYMNGTLYRTSARDYKFACVATSRESGKEFIISLGNNMQATYNSMAQYYKRHCDLKVIEIENE